MFTKDRVVLNVESLERRDLPSVITVGPGKQYATPDLVAYGSLRPGDTVEIFPTGTGQPYHSKLDLYASGEPGNPITITGMPDSTGHFPALAPLGAFTNADASYFSSQVGGAMITIAPGASAAPTDTVHDVVVQDLRLVGFRNSSGDAACDGVDMYRASNVTLQGLSVSNFIDGIFGKSYGYEPGGDLADVAILHNRVWSNGTPGYSRDHNVYVEGDHTVYEYNWIGPEVGGGAGIKDRSNQPTVAYNYIEGGLPLDLVDPDDGAPSLCHLPGFGTEWVYGNVVVLDPGGAEPVWFGFDQVAADAQTTLYFYSNTVVNEGETYWDGGLSFSGSNAVAYVFNDVFATHNPDGGSSNFQLAWVKSYAYDSVTMHLGVNLLPNGAELQDPAANITHDGDDNTLYGDPQFVNLAAGDYRLTPTSPALGVAAGVWTGNGFEALGDAGLVEPVSQWDPPTQTFISRTAWNNLGGIETDPPAPPLRLAMPDFAFAPMRQDADWAAPSSR